MEESKKIIEMYVSGKSVMAINKSLNIPMYTIRNLLQENNIHIRNRKEASACRDHSNDACPEYVPSPEEIAEKMKELRLKHFQKRRSETTINYSPPNHAIQCCSIYPTPIKQI